MSSILSAIYNFITITFVGGGILLFVGEIKLEAAKKAAQGSQGLTMFTQKITGTTLDLSDQRVYGNSSNKRTQYRK